MRIQILGTGCPTCNKFEELINQAVKELSIEDKVEKVTDIIKITDFGVMSMPALAIDGKVVLSGQLPSYEKIKELFVNALPVEEPEDEEQGGCAGCFG